MGCLARLLVYALVAVGAGVLVRRALERATAIPPPAADERDSLVDGVRWRSRERPGLGADTIVFVHGFLSSSTTWKRVVEAASGGRPAIAVDLPGAGFSDRPWPHDYTAGGAASDLLAFLDSRGVSSAVLVGNSLGGAVCLIAAAARPERFRALVLVDSAFPGSSIPLGFQLLRTPGVGELQIEFLIRPVMEYTLRHRLYARADRVTQETVDDWWRPIAVPGTRHAALQAVRTNSRGYEDLADRISVPTLVIWGKEDRLLPASDGLALASRIRSSQLVVLPDAGHLPQEEVPEAFSRSVGGFLGALAPAGPDRAPR